MFLNTLLVLSLMKFDFELLVLALTESLFDKMAGLATFIARESLGLHTSLTIGRDDDLDDLVQAAPPT